VENLEKIWKDNNFILIYIPNYYVLVGIDDNDISFTLDFSLGLAVLTNINNNENGKYVVSLLDFIWLQDMIQVSKPFEERNGENKINGQEVSYQNPNMGGTFFFLEK
jgi:hypothetical protein